MSEENMNDGAKLAVFLAGLGSVMYGISAEDMVLRLVFVVPGALAILAVLLLAAGKKRWARKIGFSSGESSLAGVVVVLIAVAVIVLVLKNAGILSIEGISGISGGEGQESDMIALSLPVKFNVAVSGVALTAMSGLENPPSASLSSITVYKNGLAWEALSVTDPANIVTNNKYESGEGLHLVLEWTVGTSTVYQSADVVVPYVDRSVAEVVPPTEHDVDVKVDVVPASSVAIHAYDSTGAAVTAFTAGNEYTISVAVAEDYAGFVTAAIPEADGSTTQFVGGLIIETNASTVDIPGARLLYSGPSKFVYYMPITLRDHMASFTVKYVGGAATSIKITAYHNIDLSYVERLGTINSEAVSVGSLTLTGSA